MASHPPDFVDEVKARTDIVEIIGADVALRPCGIAMKGLSPFNAESDPSFVVWPKSQARLLERRQPRGRRHRLPDGERAHAY